MGTDTVKRQRFINVGEKGAPQIINMDTVQSMIFSERTRTDDEGMSLKLRFAKGSYNVITKDGQDQAIRFAEQSPLGFYRKRNATFEGAEVYNYFRLDLSRIETIGLDFESLPEDAPEDAIPTQIRIAWTGDDQNQSVRRPVMDLLTKLMDMINSEEMPDASEIESFERERMAVANLLSSQAREDTLDGEDAARLINTLLVKANIAPYVLKSGSRPSRPSTATGTAKKTENGGKVTSKKGEPKVEDEATEEAVKPPKKPNKEVPAEEPAESQATA